MRATQTALLCLLCLLAGALGARLLSPAPAKPAPDQAAELRSLIRRRFYRPVRDPVLRTGALKGIVAALGDPYSEYLDPQAALAFREQIEGTFAGIGVELRPARAGARIARVLEDSPAARAKLHRGDLITAVGRRSLAGGSLTEASALVRGPAGSTAELWVRERGTARSRRVLLLRAEISVSSVSLRMLGGGLAVVKLSQFSNETGRALVSAVRRAQRRRARALVLDLRGNGGGLVDAAEEAAGVFLGPGRPVASISGRAWKREVLRSRGPRRWSGPLVVLIDRDSASAAELLAGALRDEIAVKLVGERSYGKGVVESTYNLSGGGLLKLTIAEYRTPAGARIAGRGLRPDLRTPSRRALAAARSLLRR